MLLIENGELMLGRFSHADGAVRIEHAIMAGSTMATGRGAGLGVVRRLGRIGISAAAEGAAVGGHPPSAAA